MTSRRAVVRFAASGLLVLTFASGTRAAGLRRVAWVANNLPLSAMSGPDPAEASVRAFVQGLRDLGLVDGHNIAIEWRSAEGRLEHLPAIMRELVALPVDVILAGGPALAAAREATDTIPIVAFITGPVDSALAASLAKPSRNVTGVRMTAGSEMDGKLLQLLKEAAPTTSRVAVITYHARIYPSDARRLTAESAAQVLKLELVFIGVDTPEEYEPGFAMILRERANALYVVADPINYVERRKVFEFAAMHRLPAIYEDRSYVDSGGLMSYGPNVPQLFRRAADYVDQILKGTKPADLPIEQPTTFELVVNQRAAKAIGISIPTSILMRADAVIQ